MWKRIDIAGKPADVLDPPEGVKPRFAILHLHGVSGKTLADDATFTRALTQLGLPCVCPHGQRSWWADRVCLEFDATLTAEKHVLHNVLPFMQTRWSLEPRRIGLTGISMGGQGALRLAFKHAACFPVVAGIASALDHHERYGQGSPLDEMYDSKEQCRQDTALLHVPPHDYPPHIFFCIDPEDTEHFRGNDRLHEKLTALGIPHETDFKTSAGGHSWDYFSHMAERVLRFVHGGLEKESRRLL